MELPFSKVGAAIPRRGAPAFGRALRGCPPTAPGDPLSVDSSDVARLFRKHSPLVYARALRLLGSRSEAEEVTQDAFVRLLTTTSNAPAGNQTVPWLCTLTTNLCLNRLRDHERHDLLHATVLQHTQDAEPAQQPVLVQMRRLLARADEKLARAAVYVLVDGMTHEEAAEYLEVSPRTVGNFIDRFKEWALRDMEGADGGLSGEES